MGIEVLEWMFYIQYLPVFPPKNGNFKKIDFWPPDLFPPPSTHILPESPLRDGHSCRVDKAHMVFFSRKKFFSDEKKNPFDCEGTPSNYRFPPNTPPVHEFYPLVWPTLLGITRKNDFRQKSRKNTFFVARQFDCGRRPPESNFHNSLDKNLHLPSVIIGKKPRTS